MTTSSARPMRTSRSIDRRDDLGADELDGGEQLVIGEPAHVEHQRERIKVHPLAQHPAPPRVHPLRSGGVPRSVSVERRRPLVSCTIPLALWSLIAHRSLDLPRCFGNIPCVGIPPAWAQATMWCAKYPSTSWEVPDDVGMRLGSASTADHVRRVGGGVRSSVDRAGVAARPGAVPTVAARRRDRTRSWWRGVDGCGGLYWLALRRRGGGRGWVRGAPGGAGNRPWWSRSRNSRQSLRSVFARRLRPRAACVSRRRSCWTGANGPGCTRRWSINARRGCSGSTPSSISMG
jgi:hypothetical protein